MPINFDLTQFQYKVFIETGCWKGDGVQKALNAGFEKIITIELWSEMVELCTQKFKSHIDSGRVSIIH